MRLFDGGLVGWKEGREESLFRAQIYCNYVFSRLFMPPAQISMERRGLKTLVRYFWFDPWPLTILAPSLLPRGAENPRAEMQWPVGALSFFQSARDGGFTAEPSPGGCNEFLNCCCTQVQMCQKYSNKADLDIQNSIPVCPVMEKESQKSKRISYYAKGPSIITDKHHDRFDVFQTECWALRTLLISDRPGVFFLRSNIRD